LQHFEISFDGKKQCKIVIFAILRRSPVAMVTGNLRLSENVVTEVMVQSTYVPSFISIEAFFIVL
jgi:hypothetical protein